MKTFAWKEFLQKHPIFATVRDEKRLDALLQEEVSWERFYPAGDVILRQREIGDSVFVIGAGAAEALLELGSGPPVSLSIMRRGDVFGEMALLERRARSATVRATEACTVLEIRGAEFEQLMSEHPDIEFKLLLKMSERLRNAGEQVLGLQAGTVEEKLKVFNLKLDTEQRLVDSALKASTAMSDQTKLRADEVIMSAERSRARLQWTATVIGGFVTLAITGLGFVGAKQIWDVSQAKHETVTSATAAKELKDQVQLASREVQTLVGDIRQNQDQIREAIEISRAARKELEPLRAQMNDAIDVLNVAKKSVSYILLRSLLDSVGQRSAFEANRSYATLKGLGVLSDVELQVLLDQLDESIVASALPPRADPAAAQGADAFTFLLQQMVNDAKGAREKGKAYYLLLTYAIATDQASVPGKPDADPATPRTRQHVFDEYRDFLKLHPDGRVQRADLSDALGQKIGLQSGKQAAELQRLNQLALRS